MVVEFVAVVVVVVVKEVEVAEEMFLNFEVLVLEMLILTVL